MNDAITILLKTGPLDAESEAVLCEELSLTFNKVEALKQWKFLETLQQLETTIGFFGYYYKFVE